MAQEIEAKYLDINVGEVESRLKEIGAQKVGDFLYRSTVFDYPGFPLDKAWAWLRLRDEGDKVMLAWKQRQGVKDQSGTDEGMEEIETEVGSYEETKEILLKLGLIIKFSQEKKRTRYVLGSVEFDIDTWPKLPPYLEIEGKSHEQIEEAARKLNLDPKEGKFFSTTQVYEMHGIRDKDYIEMTFDRFVKRTDGEK